MKAQLTGEPWRGGDALDRGGADLRERLGRLGRVQERSFYTYAYTLATGPRTALIGIAGVMLVAATGRYLREPKGSAPRRLEAASGKPI